MPLTQYVSTPTFEEYRERFKEHFVMERRDGIIELRMHTLGGDVQWNFELHRAIWQAFQTVGADPENRVMILTTTGDTWIANIDDSSFSKEEDDRPYYSYEHMYYDGRRMLISLINDVEIPTIGVIPGPGGHTELALMCDITICSDNAMIVDPHLDLGLVPGDGIHSAFIEILGIKRAAYALLTCDIMDAQKCLEFGLVNEVVPREKLHARAWEIAERINARKRTTLRMTVPVIRRPWKQRIADDLDGAFAMEMHAYLCDRPEHRDEIGRTTGARMSGLDEADRKKGVRTRQEEEAG
ncbi:MAG: enoyl-CoA hydratase/isomerase family protein [Myxococcota bacterium]|nr:enoyl-CoA hydratase/isomerase family protein [Myxococcota bacterium]